MLPAIASMFSAAMSPSGVATAPIGPSAAQSDNVFDSSGWTVATGGSKASGAPSAASNPWLIGAAVLAITLVAVVWLKK